MSVVFLVAIALATPGLIVYLLLEAQKEMDNFYLPSSVEAAHRVASSSKLFERSEDF